MTQSASATNVGAGGGASRSVARSQAGSGARPSGGSALRQRKSAGSSSTTSGRSTASTGGMWHFYTDDSPGIKVGPLPVLVGSLIFIATVFMLHIWGKYTRS